MLTSERTCLPVGNVGSLSLIGGVAGPRWPNMNIITGGVGVIWYPKSHRHAILGRMTQSSPGSIVTTGDKFCECHSRQLEIAIWPTADNRRRPLVWAPAVGNCVRRRGHHRAVRSRTTHRVSDVELPLGSLKLYRWAKVGCGA